MSAKLSASVPPAVRGVSSFSAIHSPVPIMSSAVLPAPNLATYSVPVSSRLRFRPGVASSNLPSETNL